MNFRDHMQKVGLHCTVKAGSQYDAGPCVTYGMVMAAYERLWRGVHKIAYG